MLRLAFLLMLLAPFVAQGGEKTTPSPGEKVVPKKDDKVVPKEDEKPRAMQVDDLFRFKRVADPQISPDGKWVVYSVGDVDLEGNKSVSRLWLASTDPKIPAKQLTSAAKSDRHPRWSPDGQTILFESSRSGSSQLWAIDFASGEPRQLTTISTAASTGLWSRDGKMIAFVSAVWPEHSDKPFKESDALNKQRIDDNEKNPVKARIADRLFFRHWDEYVENKRQHLFVVSYSNGKAGEPRDATPGDRDAYPTSTTFSIGDDFTFSPDGRHLYFTAVPARNEAWNTDHDVCRVPVTGSKKWETITGENHAADSAPQFSFDGKWFAYRAQKRKGFEADRWDLYVLPTESLDLLATRGKVAAKAKVDPPAKQAKKDGKDVKDLKDTKEKLVYATPRRLTTEFEGSVDTFIWLPDNDAIYFASDDKGRVFYFAARMSDPAGSPRLTFISHHHNSSLTVSRDGRQYAFARAAMTHPNEVMVSNTEDFAVRNVSQANTKLLATLDLPRPESVNVLGAGGVPMQMWILKPPGFDAKKKWPLVYLVHGGPQGAWEDGWSFRWNPELWAAQGYVVALPNPRGSTGFGQQYVDEISADWGGKCYQDLMLGLDYLEKQPWIDNNRMASAGASFGGYMMNWFAVNNNKFKTLITHCGVWNFESMYATTEEIWFDEWEHGGPPWGKNRASYEKHSPHRLAANLGKYKTPMLVIHNDLDFRVPVSEGIQLFTTLQRQGVPSRFLNFPDEGHWVLRPRNSQLWHREVFDWLKKHAAPGGI